MSARRRDAPRAAAACVVAALALAACADRRDGRPAAVACAGFPIQAAITNLRPGGDRCEVILGEAEGFSVESERTALRWTGYQRYLETGSATIALGFVAPGERTFLRQVGFEDALAAFASDLVRRGRRVSAVESVEAAGRRYEYRFYELDGERCAGFVSHGDYRHTGRDSRASGQVCVQGGELGRPQLRQLLGLIKFGGVGPDPVPAPFLLGTGALARLGGTPPRP